MKISNALTRSEITVLTASLLILRQLTRRLRRSRTSCGARASSRPSSARARRARGGQHFDQLVEINTFEGAATGFQREFIRCLRHRILPRGSECCIMLPPVISRAARNATSLRGNCHIACLRQYADKKRLRLVHESGNKSQRQSWLVPGEC